MCSSLQFKSPGKHFFNRKPNLVEQEDSLVLFKTFQAGLWPKSNTLEARMEELSEGLVLQLLDDASASKNVGTDAQKLAEQKLKILEIQSGFHYYLQSIYLNVNNPLNLRWLAIIQFKNGVDKYWRASRTNAIKKDEKALIRERLLKLTNEKNNQLSIQNAQATSKIARLDFPSDWPNLFEEIEYLISTITFDEASYGEYPRYYNISIHINQIIKILCSAKIGRCKPAMQIKIPLIINQLINIYMTSFNVWKNALSNANMTMIPLEITQISYLALKILRRIICDAVDHPEKDESICEFMDCSIQHLELLVGNYDVLNKKIDNYEKFIKCYGKLYYNQISSSTMSFILLPCSIKILISYTKLVFEKTSEVYNENSDATGDFWEQIIIKSLLFLKKVINFVSKKGVITLRAKSDKVLVDKAIVKINNDFLNENLINSLLDTLILWYLKLRPSELENWFMDPEEWINEQISNSYEYQIRPCAENFFQDLINDFKDLLVPRLLNKVETDSAQLSDSNSLDDFLTKDSLYASFQLSANAICDLVDFDRLLTQVFLPEVNNVSNVTSPDKQKILKRRISLIINDWSTVKCSEESKALCYGLFTDLLMKEDDKVVLLTVVKSLRTMIDDWGFNKDTFRPYLNDIVNILLTKILPSVSLTETRLYVLNTLSDLIIQTKPLVSEELLIAILQVVPQLWEISINNLSESILSTALIRLLKNLIISLGEKSHLTWDISIPIVNLSCNPSSPHYQILNEDGYELWNVLLQNYSQKEKEFDQRFLDVIPFLENGVETHTEILPTLLEIVKSYSLILSPKDFFAFQPFLHIFSHLSQYLLKLRDDSFFSTLEIWELLILADESDQETILLKNFYDTQVLSALFDSIFKYEPLSNYQCGQLLQIIARISYVNPNALMNFISLYHQNLLSSAQNSQLPKEERKIVFCDMSIEQLMLKLVNSWIFCMKDMFDPKIKKVHILGISSLLRTGSFAVLNELSAILSIWIEFLEEIHETEGGDCEKYHLNDIVTEQSAEFFQLTPEQIRNHELLRNNDPAHNISFKEFALQTMRFLESHLGEQKYSELMNSLDQNVKDNLQTFLVSVGPSTS